MLKIFFLFFARWFHIVSTCTCCSVYPSGHAVTMVYAICKIMKIMKDNRENSSTQFFRK